MSALLLQIGGSWSQEAWDRQPSFPVVTGASAGPSFIIVCRFCELGTVSLVLKPSSSVVNKHTCACPKIANVAIKKLQLRGCHLVFSHVVSMALKPDKTLLTKRCFWRRGDGVSRSTEEAV